MMKGLSLSLWLLVCCSFYGRVAKQVPLFKHNFICVKVMELRCKPIPAASSKCSTTCTSTRLGKAATSASQSRIVAGAASGRKRKQEGKALIGALFYLLFPQYFVNFNFAHPFFVFIYCCKD
ncbi:hypothetical protein BDR26DRAFT_852978 [Obelidium mucronatum]|nr:hypothetical protein BDR26DRAFT_852978 [Obelidium mucronatum]